MDRDPYVIYADVIDLVAKLVLRVLVVALVVSFIAVWLLAVRPELFGPAALVGWLAVPLTVVLTLRAKVGQLRGVIHREKQASYLP